MIQELTDLNKDEKDILCAAPVLITFLIAGSDNHVDEKEREWGQKLVEFRSMRNDSELISYYLDAERCWEQEYQRYAAALIDQGDTDLRSHFISKELEKLNPVLNKLPSTLAHKLYKSFRSYAEQVARASGGVFGLGAISADEQKWLNLSMIKEPTGEKARSYASPRDEK